SLDRDQSRRRRVVEDAAVSTHLARKTLEVATHAGALDRIVLSGFGRHALAWIRQAEPRVLTQWAIVSADIAEDAPRAATEWFEELSPQMNGCTRAHVTHAHAHCQSESPSAGTRGESSSRSAWMRCTSPGPTV